MILHVIFDIDDGQGRKSENSVDVCLGRATAYSDVLTMLQQLR